VNVTVVVGNPKPKSRTRNLAEAVAASVAERTGGSLAETVDLADFSGSIFSWPDPAMLELSERVAASSVVVIASPTYKATYTGLLKAFLDRYPNDGLAGVTAIPVMTGAGPEHAMAVETNLRPVLVELGASVPTRGLFFSVTEMEQMHDVVEAWAQRNLNGGGLFGPIAREV
jgi:FMN reductase